VEVPVWRHNSDGPDLRVGQRTDFVAFLEPTGPVLAGDGPNVVEAAEDGAVRVIGTNRGSRQGPNRVPTVTVVESGLLRFAIPGSHASAVIECSGKLWDLGVQAGTGVCHGVVRGVLWHKEILKVTHPRKDLEHSEGVGYYEGAPVSSTGAGVGMSGAFELIVELVDPSPQDEA